MLCTITAKFLKQSKKNKKKKTKQYKKDITRKLKKQIPATNNNTIDISKKKKKRNINKITCFHYDKKTYYTNICTKPLKN